MASIINIPFNFQPPVAPSVKTTSYTVPAGKYAKVRAFFYSPRTVTYTTVGSQTLTVGQITLNGNNLLSEKQINYTYNYTTSLTSGSTTHSFPGFSGLFTGYISSANTNNWILSPTSPTIQIAFSGNTTSPYTVFAVSGQLTYSSMSGSQGILVVGTIVSNSVPDYIDFWAKEGDVITGTAGNWKLIVNEYNVVS